MEVTFARAVDNTLTMEGEGLMPASDDVMFTDMVVIVIFMLSVSFPFMLYAIVVAYATRKEKRKL